MRKSWKKLEIILADGWWLLLRQIGKNVAFGNRYIEEKGSFHRFLIKGKISKIF